MSRVVSSSPDLRRVPVVESTNSAARELAKEGAGEGTFILAEKQISGRGSSGRVWHSPEGGVFLSGLMRASDAKRVTDLSLLAGVAVAQSVREFLPSSVEVSVKWPNDCLIGKRKVSGVLSEAILGDLCVVGIGVNVNVAASELTPFAGNRFPATSFLMETGGKRHDKDRFVDVLLAKLWTGYQLYHKEGFPKIQALWERQCAFLGKRVEIQGADLAPFTGTCLGIDESGALVLSTADGVRRRFFAGEITCFWL